MFSKGKKKKTKNFTGCENSLPEKKKHPIMAPLQIRKSKSDFNVNASKCELWLKEKY
jgi:hypothetical protein